MHTFHSIEVNQLVKHYNKAVEPSLKGISFKINAGETVGVLGPNGAGKSTLISILTGVLDPSSGAVNYLDQNHQVLQKEELKFRIGYAPQEYAIFDDLTPDQHLNYFGALYELDKSVITERSDELLQVFGLVEVRKKKVKTFSGGMKRRLNLALSLINQPEILFLDEPTAGVDVHNKQLIIDYLMGLREKGTTLFYTSHHMDEASHLCDRIILLNKGAVKVDESFQQLMDQHQNENLTSLFIKLTNT